MFTDKRLVGYIKKAFQKGTRVVLVQDTCDIAKGSRGTVFHVDDNGTLFVCWDNGISTGLYYGVDDYRLESQYMYEQIIEKLRKDLEEIYSDIEVLVLGNTVIHGVKQNSIVIKGKNDRIGLTINCEVLNNNYDEVFKSIIEAYEDRTEINVEELLSDYEENLYFTVKHKDICDTDELVCKPLGDTDLIKIVVFIKDQYAFYFKKDLATFLEKSEDELFELALINTLKSRYSVIDINEVITQKTDMNLEDCVELKAVKLNTSSYGAGILAVNKFLKELEEEYGTYVVIPCSEDEILMMCGEEAKKVIMAGGSEELMEIISYVNSTLNKRKILSYSSYFVKNGKLRVLQEKPYNV